MFLIIQQTILTIRQLICYTFFVIIGTGEAPAKYSFPRNSRIDQGASLLLYIYRTNTRSPHANRQKSKTTARRAQNVPHRPLRTKRSAAGHLKPDGTPQNDRHLRKPHEDRPCPGRLASSALQRHY